MIVIFRDDSDLYDSVINLTESNIYAVFGDESNIYGAFGDENEDDIYGVLIYDQLSSPVAEVF